MPFPSVANILQDKLETGKIPTMDQLAACSGFMYSMITAKQYIQSGDYHNILVVGADKLSKITDLTDRSTAVLFGDGAGAAVIGEVSEGRGIISYEMGSDGSGGKYLYLNQENGKLVMNGREVFKFAVRIMGEASKRVVEKAGLKSEDIDMFVPHQANIRIMESARERLGLDKDKMSVSVNRFGNTSAASIPLSINQELENGRIKDDDTLVLVGFGGGLTWALWLSNGENRRKKCMSEKNRVVITGIGALSPIGNDAHTSWNNALKGVNGIDEITQLIPTRIT